MKLFTTFFVLMKLFIICSTTVKSSDQLGKIWGPGLSPEKIVMPARYFFVNLITNNGSTVGENTELQVVVDGKTKNNKPCRIWTNVLDRKDNSYIVRYKLYETCSYLKISVTYNNEHLAKSPYLINSPVKSDDCVCPTRNINKSLNAWECGSVPKFINDKLSVFRKINWTEQRKEIIERFNQPHSVSLCHYIVKNNKIYRKCYGKYVGFNIFVDNILLSLTRKVVLPDVEFFSNLGDWPLSTLKKKYPIFSWCGSTDSFDIIMPTYDITESTLENLGRVTLDVLSVQGNTDGPWETRIPKLFWRGRDSNQYRLELIKLSKEYPDLINASLTNFFFYRDQEHIYGPKTEHISFFKFFQYKYQLAIDGTVATYRMPYLLAGGSLVFKPESKYFEHYYKDLKPYVHYVPVKSDISDLIEKIKWAINNDKEAKEIASNAQKFVNENLLPKNIFCYYFHLFNEFSKIITSNIEILEDMEFIEQKKMEKCDCNNKKDEL
ncbi:protein O-glucosyltransferase 2-like isoform X1 [Diorhabda sublineata]|uniref:protein O-glucosyltransferase 2-like isoform X1 n=1 Tax=Diorhabda sublineata TaxID=1163346 RepID=UPI0024E05D08|nr:protein O-glucosyltransferase 2-like isoform X1 [Diorhabda sublineata]